MHIYASEGEGLDLGSIWTTPIKLERKVMNQPSLQTDWSMGTEGTPDEASTASRGYRVSKGSRVREIAAAVDINLRGSMSSAS